MYKEFGNESNKYLWWGVLCLLLLFALASILVCDINESLERERDALLKDYEALKTHYEELVSVTTDKAFVPVVVKRTAYAPLDPRAVEGMCYSGDPRITASGAASKPYKTVAMGPSIPFGTEVYIPGRGLRVVEDRGGAIKDDCLDEMVLTQEEAYNIGVQKNTLIFIRLDEVE